MATNKVRLSYPVTVEGKKRKAGDEVELKDDLEAYNLVKSGHARYVEDNKSKTSTTADAGKNGRS